MDDDDDTGHLVVRLTETQTIALYSFSLANYRVRLSVDVRGVVSVVVVQTKSHDLVDGRQFGANARNALSARCSVRI